MQLRLARLGARPRQVGLAVALLSLALAGTGAWGPSVTFAAAAPATVGAAVPPMPYDQGAAADAGAQSRSPHREQVADSSSSVESYAIARVFATQYNPNTPGSVEVAVPDKCAKFAATSNTAGLQQYNCGPGYVPGAAFNVFVATDTGGQAVLPVKDVGPWNTDDNYWDFGPGAPRPRRMFTDLPPGTPESLAAFNNGYNSQPNCNNLDGTPSGHAGGSDQFGRCVLNPAGIDLSVAAAQTLGLGPGQNAWVYVVYLWEPIRNNIQSVNSGKNVDVNGGSTANGAQAIQWTPHLGANQQWRFEPVTSTTYRIVCVNSGKVLDVYGGSTADGTPVVQWAWGGGPNQQWHIDLVGPGIFRITSALSGKSLDVAGGSTADGAPLIEWTAHGGPNQQWRLNPLGTG